MNRRGVERSSSSTKAPREQSRPKSSSLNSWYASRDSVSLTFTVEEAPAGLATDPLRPRTADRPPALKDRQNSAVSGTRPDGGSGGSSETQACHFRERANRASESASRLVRQRAIDMRNGRARVQTTRQVSSEGQGIPDITPRIVRMP
jgi:hypothetical protein